MTRSERVRYERLLRVRDFGTTHADRFPESSNGARGFADLARIISAIDKHVAEKTVAVRESRRAKSDRRKAMLARMKEIVRTSRGIRSETGAPLALKMPKKTSDIAIISGARAFLQEAEPYQEQLIGLGLPASYFAELKETTDAFDMALMERRTGRSAVAGAQAGIAKALVEGANAALTLDIIVVNLLGGDDVAMASWNRDRGIVDWRSKKTAVVATAETPALGGEAPAQAPAEATADPLKKAS